MKTYTYRIIIEPDERNTFHAYVPALPGCHTWGKTIQEARKNAKDAIGAYVRVLVADGEKIPEDKGVEIIEMISFPSPMKRKSLSYV
ncbi:type II toxin-antitoxin system HicB family antitoxin [Candidatus Azambacteria bacterium]|nr:type II toxin-antitoxin system HicB family antitoxin [Candidatus Azambacteria bacterium]MBI3685684.1 type II toxin-antitoxin system HicB family antitoxin [Candidatus Azambacteria bacterium]